MTERARGAWPRPRLAGGSAFGGLELGGGDLAAAAVALQLVAQPLAFVQARPAEGGAGALVVLLQPGRRRFAQGG